MTRPLLTTSTELLAEHLVVHVLGEVDLSSAPILDQALADARAAQPAPAAIVADLTGVVFLGSVGLSILLAADARGRDTGVPLIVVATPRSPAHRSIQITALDQVLSLADSVDQAIPLP